VSKLQSRSGNANCQDDRAQVGRVSTTLSDFVGYTTKVTGLKVDDRFNDDSCDKTLLLACICCACLGMETTTRERIFDYGFESFPTFLTL